MKKYFSDYVLLFTLAGIVILVDQLTKSWIRATLAYGEVYRPDLWLSQYARLMHHQNTGAAFGMFQNLGDVFMVLSFVVSAAILYYFPQVPRRDWTLRLAMGLQLGGAVGNLIDRLSRGYVTDFISLGNFAVFNVADASISMGVAILVIGMWLNERKSASPKSLVTPTEEPLVQNPTPVSLPEEPQGE